MSRAAGQQTESRLVDLPQRTCKVRFGENSRGENGAFRELTPDDTLWDRLNQDHDVWYIEYPRLGVPGCLQL